MEKSKLYEEIRANIKRITTIGGMSQAGLARDAGIDQSQISNFVREKGGITLANACKILEALEYRIVPPQEKITKEDAESLRAEIAHAVNAYLAGMVEDKIRYRVGDIITGVAQKRLATAKRSRFLDGGAPLELAARCDTPRVSCLRASLKLVE